MFEYAIAALETEIYDIENGEVPPNKKDKLIVKELEQAIKVLEKAGMK